MVLVNKNLNSQVLALRGSIDNASLKNFFFFGFFAA